MTLKTVKLGTKGTPPHARLGTRLLATALGLLLAAPAAAGAQDSRRGSTTPLTLRNDGKQVAGDNGGTDAYVHMRTVPPGTGEASAVTKTQAANATAETVLGAAFVDPSAPVNSAFAKSTADVSSSPQSGKRPGAQPGSHVGERPGTAAAAVVVPEETAAPLYFEEVLRQVEENYPKLLGADAERRIASAKLLEKQGAFDPVLSVSSDYLRFNSTSTRGRVGNAQQNEVSFELPTRSGIKYISGGRINTGNVKSPLSSTGDAGEYFGGIKIPFLRDRGINPKFAAEQQARLGEPLASAEFQRTRLEILTVAAYTYYDWVAAKRRIDVNNRLYELARLRANQIRDRVRAGDLPPIDETEANQEIQRRRANVIKSTLDFQKAALKLSNYLWDSSGTPSPLPAPYRVPDRLPPPVILAETEAEEARRFALERRPELQSLRLSRDINDVDLRLARNQRRPGFDLSFAPGLDNGDRSIGPTMKVGVTLTLPFRRREAEGQIAQTQLKNQKINFDEQSERLRILNEVNDATAQINAAYARYLAVAEELALSRLVERGEQQRYDAGDSTLFLVNQRERATAEAEIKLVEAEIEYRQATALLRSTSGQL